MEFLISYRPNLVVLFNIDSKAKSDSKSKTQAIMDIMIRAALATSAPRPHYRW